MALRTKQIILRVTNDEYHLLQRMKTKPRLAQWIRETCLIPESIHLAKQVKKADPQLLYALARIGGNMNQIAKYINTHGVIDRILLLNELNKIQEYLDYILFKKS